jgi:hypothetical protein
MACQEHLPIYRTTMEFCVYLENTVKNLSESLRDDDAGNGTFFIVSAADDQGLTLQ